MLVIGRKLNQSFSIGEAVVKVVSVKGNTVRLAIAAPQSVRVLRDDARKREAA